MERLKRAVLYFFGLFVLLLGVFQLDVTKRFIASRNHSINLPDYFTNVQLNKPETRLSFNSLNTSETTGVIPQNKIESFYKQLNGQQIFLSQAPMGNFQAVQNQLPNDYSIAFRDKRNQLHSAYCALDSVNQVYNIRIYTSNE